MYNNQYSSNEPQARPLFEDTSTPNSGAAYGYNEYQHNVFSESGSSSFRRHPQVATMVPDQTMGFTPPQFLNDPMMTNMAMQYGQNLVGQSKQFVDSKLEKYMSFSKLKYYFAVDTNYVFMKNKLLFFPFNHEDWSIKYDRDEPVQPRYDLNAPDLYIPLMAFVTYILLTGFYLGIQQRFSPDMLGIQASWTIVWLVLELLFVFVLLQVTSVHTKLHFLHLLSLASYKYVGMISSLIAGLLLNMFGYISCLSYCSFAMFIFLFRTLRCQIQGTSDHDYSAGNKKRFYILVVMATLQPVMMWVLTWHLVTYSAPEMPAFNNLNY